MSGRVHTHPCAHCKTPVECHGELERNHDGWPEVICVGYHHPGGAIGWKHLCDSCEEAVYGRTNSWE